MDTSCNFLKKTHRGHLLFLLPRRARWVKRRLPRVRKVSTFASNLAKAKNIHLRHMITSNIRYSLRSISNKANSLPYNNLFKTQSRRFSTMCRSRSVGLNSTFCVTIRHYGTDSNSQKEYRKPEFTTGSKNFLFNTYCYFVGKDSITSTFKRWFRFNSKGSSTTERDWILNSMKTAKTEYFFVLVLLFFISLVALLGLASYMDSPEFGPFNVNYLPFVLCCMLVILGITLLVLVWVLAGIGKDNNIPEIMFKHLSVYKYFVFFALLLDFIVFYFLSTNMTWIGYILAHVPYVLLVLLLPLLLHLIYSLKRLNMFERNYSFRDGIDSFTEKWFCFHTWFVMVRHTIVYFAPFVYFSIYGHNGLMTQLVELSCIIDIIMFILVSFAVMGIKRTFQAFIFLILFIAFFTIFTYFTVWTSGWLYGLIFETFITLNRFPYSSEYRSILLGPIGIFIVTNFHSFTGLDELSFEVIRIISRAVFAIFCFFFCCGLSWIHKGCVIVNKVYLTEEWSYRVLNKELCGVGTIPLLALYIRVYSFLVYLFVSMLTIFIPREWHFARTLLTFLFCSSLFLLFFAAFINIASGPYLDWLDTLFHM
jgi:hypothetical protein